MASLMAWPSESRGRLQQEVGLDPSALPVYGLGGVDKVLEGEAFADERAPE